MTKNKVYKLHVSKNSKELDLQVQASTAAHAAAQAEDICRALNATSYTLHYQENEATKLCTLFKKLAFSLYNPKICEPWEHSFSNNVPCLYVFNQRYYVRTLILRYLDIPREGIIARPSCICKSCINPYHFSYRFGKNSKLTGGDVQMLLAFMGQGAGVSQAAKALKVHRSTIYRKLKNEHLSVGSENYRPRSN